MKKYLSLLVVACMVAFTVACNQEGNAGDSGNSTDAPDATKTEVKTDATNAADPNAATEEADTGPKTTIEFDEMTHDFGNIKEGDKVSHVFKFKNTGNEPLIINSAKGSCGCTVPEWPKEPIAPGGDGQIKVEFNSKGKKNKQTKTVTINANTDPNPTRLTIKAEVEPSPESAAADAAKKDAKPAGK